MKRIITILFFIFVGAGAAVACNVCGSSSSATGVGILPFDELKNFAGLKYNYRCYHAHSHHGNSEDHFKRFDVIGTFNILSKTQLTTVIPYVINTRKSSNSTIELQGIGDAYFLLNHIFINTGKNDSKVAQMLTAGGGAKLATGEYNKKTDVYIPQNFNAGTGSNDLLLNAKYSVFIDNSAINLMANYRYTSYNRYNYKFGNQGNFTGFYSYKWETKNFKIQPYTGAMYEKIAMDKSDEIVETTTGGTGLFALGGVNILRGIVSVGANFQQPVVQNYGQQQINARGQWNGSVLVFF